MRRVRGSGLFLWAVVCGLAMSTAIADELSVVEASDLSVDARLVESRRIPLLLLFSREDCGYCELLKRAVIIPMILSGEYDNRVIIREIFIDRPSPLVDFAGREVSPFAIANRYDAFLTPAVVLVGPAGAELGERLLGISNEDMYLFYLDQAISAATGRLHQRAEGSGDETLDQSR